MQTPYPNRIFESGSHPPDNSIMEVRGSFYVFVGFSDQPDFRGWWRCHQIKSVTEPHLKLYKAKEGGRYVFSDRMVYEPGSCWYAFQKEYQNPVEILIYPPEVSRVVYRNSSSEKAQ